MVNLPAIAPDQTRQCAICGSYQSYIPGMEKHHWIPRSLGGTLTVTLCVRCHNKTEGNDAWKVVVTDAFLYVLDGDEIIIQRPVVLPEGWDEGDFLVRLQNAPQHLSELSSDFVWLTDEGIRAAAEALGELSQASWVLRARLFRTALLRTPYGEKGERLREIARLFGLERAQAYKEAKAIDIAEQRGLVYEIDNVPGPDAILLAEKSGNAEAALELLQDRRANNKAYSLTEFKEELRRGNTDSLQPAPQYHRCECGHLHIDLRSGEKVV